MKKHKMWKDATKLIRHGFVACECKPPRYFVNIGFDNLDQAQELHSLLVSIARKQHDHT
jgi:hypothetical protein